MNTQKYEVFEVDWPKEMNTQWPGEFQICLGPMKVCIIPKWDGFLVDKLRAQAKNIAAALNDEEQLRTVTAMAKMLRDTTRFKDDGAIQSLAAQAWKVK